LAAGPFVQPGPAFLIGLLAGISVPFITYLMDKLLRLDDRTGVISMMAIPALLGLLLVGVLADGVVGQSWQMTGLESYLGVTGQGVSGLLVASGYQPDFPGQFQAQLIGIVALGLWGLITGVVVCVPMGLLFHGLQRDSRRGRKAQNEENPPRAASAPRPQNDNIPVAPPAAIKQSTPPSA